MTTETVSISDLPIALRSCSASDAAGDARHISQIADSAMTSIAEITSQDDETRANLERVATFVWVIRDLAESLEWKLNRFEVDQIKNCVS